MTGGTTGLGHAIALGPAEAGAEVVASSRRLEQVEKAAGEIEALGRRTLRVASDVLDRDSAQALHDAAPREFGKVDILVNAAGITHKAPLLELGEADWRRVMETNLTGPLGACQIFGCPYPGGDRTSNIPAGFDLSRQWVAEPQDRMTLQQNARRTKNANQSRL
jgi:NAD(P)-dependent dehydrogenase (short-subunit alcohol dehydrogenase family)